MSLLGYAQIHGTTATLKTITAGTYDPETGTGPDSAANETVHLINVSQMARETGEGIDTEDLFYLLPAEEVAAKPTTEHWVYIGTAAYEIVDVKPVEKHGSDHFYRLQLRLVKS